MLDSLSHRRLPVALVVALACTALTGCFARVDAPDLGGIYDRAAMAHDADRNPVIVIPGILGSRLLDEPSGRVVWGAFTGDFAHPGRDDGARLVALPMAPGAALADLRDGAVSDGALDRLRLALLWLPVELNAYVHILGTLGVGGYRDEGLGLAGAVDYGDDHYTCFQFAYDWRRDNVENARRLHEFILEKRAYLQEKLAERFGEENAEVKFDIVAHSMGGLVTRYMLRYGDRDLPADGSVPPVTWAGTAHVDRVIMVGTPNAGSAKALIELVEGADFAPILPRYAPAIMGTMPAIYQLLPRTRHRALVTRDDHGGEPLDLLDPEVWIEMGWGLADPDEAGTLRRLLPDAPDDAARREIALDHLRKCLARARQFAAALDQPAPEPPSTELYLVAGDATDTPATIEADRRSGRIRVAGHGPGDGTVLRSSALLDERVGQDWRRTLPSPIPWEHALFLFTDHLGLTKDPVFTDNVLYLLLEKPGG